MSDKSDKTETVEGYKAIQAYLETRIAERRAEVDAIAKWTQTRLAVVGVLTSGWLAFVMKTLADRSSLDHLWSALAYVLIALVLMVAFLLWHMLESLDIECALAKADKLTQIPADQPEVAVRKILIGRLSAALDVEDVAQAKREKSARSVRALTRAVLVVLGLSVLTAIFAITLTPKPASIASPTKECPHAQQTP